MSDSPASRVGSSYGRWAAFKALLAGNNEQVAPTVAPAPQQRMTLGAAPTYHAAAVAARDVRQNGREESIRNGNARLQARFDASPAGATARVDGLLAKAAPAVSVPLGSQYGGSTLRQPVVKAAPKKAKPAAKKSVPPKAA